MSKRRQAALADQVATRVLAKLAAPPAPAELTQPPKIDPRMFDEMGVHDLMTGLDGLLADPENLGPEVWEKMATDAQVKACDLVITLPIKKMEWHLQAESPAGKEIAKWAEQTLLAMDDTAHFYIGQALLYLRYGRGAAELVWRKDGDQILLQKLKFYHPRSWDYKLDPVRKTLAGIVQHVGTEEITIKAGINKLAVFVHEREFGAWHGRSLYRASHKPWTIKEFGLRIWNVAMEKYASPFLLGKYPQGGDIGLMLAIINGIKSKTGVALPEGYDLEMKEAQRQGLSYQDMVMYQDKQIARGMFVPDLIFANDKTGAYSLGDSQSNFFIMREDSIARDLEDVLTKYVVAPLCRFNFPKARPQDMPRWKFAGLTKEDKKSLSEMVERMINGNVIEPDEPWIRERLGMPPAEADALKKLKRLGLNQSQILKGMLDGKVLKPNDVRTLIFGLERDPELDKPPAPPPIPGQPPLPPGAPAQADPKGKQPAPGVKPGTPADKALQAAGEDMLERLHTDLAEILRLGRTD